jgi:starch synthase (maltosyl-transferring)
MRQSSIEIRQWPWGLTPCSSLPAALPLGRRRHSVFLVKEAGISQVNGQARVVIEGVTPEIDGGRFPIKRVPGEGVAIEADIFADGHDVLSAVLKWRRVEDENWSETPMEPLVNDRWTGSFTPDSQGTYVYTVEGWIDRFATWRSELEKKVKAGQEVIVELQAGAAFI